MEKGRGKGSAVLVLLMALLILQGCGGGGSDESANARINLNSGSTNGAVPDERLGTPPPPAKNVDVEKAAEAAECYLFQKVSPQTERELAAEPAGTKYPYDPPLSGPHVPPPHQQADGAYLVTPEESATVGSLNNGRMTIQYAPDVPEEQQLELKGLYDTMYGGTLFFPNPTMDFVVAATTWSNVLGCPGWAGVKTLNAIRAFGKATWGKYGNVPVDKFPVEGPTPANPKEANTAG
jgi:hypothetical protein